MVGFNHLVNEYLNCLFMIGNILVCKLNVIPVALLIYAIPFQQMFERNVCRALILVGVKIEGWKTFDRNLG